MTARKRASHVARGRRHQGRAAQWRKNGAEKAERERVADEQRHREMALTEAQRQLRAEEKIHRERAAARREYDAAERERRERLIGELRAAVADRERELGALAGVMVTIPAPEPVRGVRRKPEDQAAGWSRPRKAPARTVAELRKLNGLD